MAWPPYSSSVLAGSHPFKVIHDQNDTSKVRYYREVQVVDEGCLNKEILYIPNSLWVCVMDQGNYEILAIKETEIRDFYFSNKNRFEKSVLTKKTTITLINEVDIPRSTMLKMVDLARKIQQNEYARTTIYLENIDLKRGMNEVGTQVASYFPQSESKL